MVLVLFFVFFSFFSFVLLLSCPYTVRRVNLIKRGQFKATHTSVELQVYPHAYSCMVLVFFFFFFFFFFFLYHVRALFDGLT